MHKKYPETEFSWSVFSSIRSRKNSVSGHFSCSVQYIAFPVWHIYTQLSFVSKSLIKKSLPVILNGYIHSNTFQHFITRKNISFSKVSITLRKKQSKITPIQFSLSPTFLHSVVQGRNLLHFRTKKPIKTTLNWGKRT